MRFVDRAKQEINQYEAKSKRTSIASIREGTDTVLERIKTAIYTAEKTGNDAALWNEYVNGLDYLEKKHIGRELRNILSSTITAINSGYVKTAWAEQQKQDIANNERKRYEAQEERRIARAEGRKEGSAKWKQIASETIEEKRQSEKREAMMLGFLLGREYQNSSDGFQFGSMFQFLGLNNKNQTQLPTCSESARMTYPFRPS